MVTEEIRAALFQALGEASMCWDPIPEGRFESERALAVGDRFMKFLFENLGGFLDELRELDVK